MVRYRRKVTAPIAPIQWTGENVVEVREFVGRGAFEVLWDLSDVPTARLWCASSSQWLVMTPGDWVLPELDGSGWYKCDGAVFESTYEPV